MATDTFNANTLHANTLHANTFEDVKPTVHYPALEEKILQLWRQRDVFRRSVAEREGAPDYVFFEGPPTANGRPGIHHVLARAFKDMFPRYKVMQGYQVLRPGGWDTHGLPVEIEVEKQLGLSGKQQIEEYGVARFNQRSRASAQEYIGEWEKLTERMGFWVDLDNAYVTFHRDYVESLWWILQQLWDRELLYQGYKVVPYCPRCGTPLSSHELALGYKDGTVDPSVYVKFRLRDAAGEAYLLAWTTTPWTLPGNVALAVGEEIEYLKVQESDGTRLYVAAARAEAVLKPDYTVLERLSGRELVGLRYEPLYAFLPVDQPYAYVVAADFVSTEDGTGIVHIAPAFGAVDMEVGRAHGLPLIQTVNAAGQFRPEVTPWAGVFVKEADPAIEAELAQRGLLYRSGTYEHTYPFCWRCDTPLIYYAKETWYIRTSAYRERLVALNAEINWVPDHIKQGRFGNWLENNVDWALGRDRYWGTPLPIWKSDAPGSRYMECVGSVAELEERVGRNLENLDLHRPDVDELTWPAPDGGTMRRVLEVADTWFDSGSMPVAQYHYPFENQALWARQQQADFICEAIDQTRGWFYTLHAVSTLLFDRPAFKNVICLGHILAEDGSKMSKSKGNVVNPWEAFNAHGADATRWTMYTAGPPGNSRRFSLSLVAEVVRKFLNTLWNSYSFFVTYANFSPAWQPTPECHSANLLDRWLLSETHRLVRDVTAAMEEYDVLGATRPIAEFVDNLSNWYVRLSRRRFWESDAAALDTLHQVLVTLSKLLAPTMPFIAEEFYQNLVVRVDPTQPDSVHLSRWPQADPARMDEVLSADMALVQKIASLGHAARQAANLKVRQPLAQVVVRTRQPAERASLQRHQELLLGELNVKELLFVDAGSDLVEVQIHPLPKQLGQKYGRGLPIIRQALASMDQVMLASRFRAGETVEIHAGEALYTVEAADVEVRSTPHIGLSVAEDGGYLVAITTVLTQELEEEGHSRELVRRIQQMRKDAGLEISDRIVTHITATPLVHRLLASFGSYVQEETLTVNIHQVHTELGEQIPEQLFQTRFDLGSDPVTVAIGRNQ